MIEFIVKVINTLLIQEVFVFIPLIFLFYYSIFFFVYKKNFLQGLLILFLPLFFIFYQYSYLPNFFSSLGQDSLLELNSDLGETIFYIKTFFSFLLDPEIFNRNRFWLVLISFFFQQ